MSAESRSRHHQSSRSSSSSSSSSSSCVGDDSRGGGRGWSSSSSSKKSASSKDGEDEGSRCSIRRWCSQLVVNLEEGEEEVVVPTMKPRVGFFSGGVA